VTGNAEVTITMVPPNRPPYTNYLQNPMFAGRDPWDYSVYPKLSKYYEYVSKSGFLLKNPVIGHSVFSWNSANTTNMWVKDDFC